jgi:hypothetical protein
MQWTPYALILGMVVVQATSTVPKDISKKVAKFALAGDQLLDGVPALGEAAREKLYCGPNAADRRVFLFVNDRPLGDVMKHLRLFIPVAPGTASWYRDGTGVTFDEDLASKDARKAAARKRKRFAEAQRGTGYQEVRAWAQPRIGEQTALAAGRKQARQYLGVFSGMPADQQQAALCGQHVRVSYAMLSPRARALIHELVGRVVAGKEGSDTDRFDGRTDCPNVIVEVLPTGTPDRPGLTMRLRLCPSVGRSVRDIANPPAWNPAKGWDWTHHYKDHTGRVRGPVGRASNPTLQRRITLAGGAGKSIEVVLAEFGRESGLPVLGEYDPCFLTPYEREKNGRRELQPDQVTNVPLWQALDIVAKRFDLDWDYREGWIWIRSPRTLLSWSGEMDLSPPEREATENANR